MKTKTEEKPYNDLMGLMHHFSDTKVCREHMMKLRWNDGITCPHCNHAKFYRFKDGVRFKCANKACLKKFNVLTKTVFENSKIPLQKWFVAIFLLTSHKKGISSIQLGKDIKVTQTTAWFMMHRIREMLKQNNPTLLSDVVEVDETYIGGKYKNKHFNKKKKGQQGRGGTEKVPVFGMLQRGGKVISMSVKDVSGKSLKPLIYKHVEAGSTIMSDEWKAYRGLNKTYTHQVIKHGKFQYVSGTCYTNTIEGYWSLVKRSVLGIYHQISRKHTDRYCKEFDFRYNTKKMDEQSRFDLAFTNKNHRLKYKELTKSH